VNETAPYWTTTAPPAPATFPLGGDVRCDVAVIGGGILGLSAALALAERGVSVVLLEAAEIGAGASGRNGGLVVPSLPRIGPDAVRQLLGEDYAARLLALVAGGAATVFATIRRHAIDCEATQSGWLLPAHAASLMPGVAARARAWQAAGARCVVLDAAETRDRMGGERYHGALFDPTGGHVNPLAYCRGLASAVLRAGGRIHTRSPVMMARDAGGWVLTTPGGTVSAARVVQCTNVQTPGVAAARAARDSLVPLTVYQLATQDFPPEVRAKILRGDEAFSDTRNNLLACRWTAGGRLVTGGMAALQTGALARLPRALARRLEAVFPALGAVRFDYVWRGTAALTGDFLPRLHAVAPAWLAAAACNGRGIALSTALGPALAAYAMTGDAGALPLPITPPTPLRLPGLARLVPQLLLPLGDWQDRRAERVSKTFR
jgi:glycine/D-amino acid oxidase-like deaminating enzyme